MVSRTPQGLPNHGLSTPGLEVGLGGQSWTCSLVLLVNFRWGSQRCVQPQPFSLPLEHGTRVSPNCHPILGEAPGSLLGWQ